MGQITFSFGVGRKSIDPLAGLDELPIAWDEVHSIYTMYRKLPLGLWIAAKNPIWWLRFEFAIHLHAAFCGPAISPHGSIF